MSPRLNPGPLGDTILYRLRVAHSAVRRRFEAMLGHYGIAPRYLGLLAIIGNQPGQPQSRLAEAVSLKRSSLVAIIDRLADEGVVERRPSATDRRANSVWLTEHGERTLSELVARAQQEETRLAAGLSAEERAALAHLLSRIADNLA